VKRGEQAMAFAPSIENLTSPGMGDRAFIQFHPAAVGTWAFGKTPGRS
jgi:hypothetical protein